MTNAGIEPATFCAHTCLCKTDAITTRPIGPFDIKLLRLLLSFRCNLVVVHLVRWLQRRIDSKFTSVDSKCPIVALGIK